MTAAVERAHELYVALRGPAGAVHAGKVVTVFSPKGGVGKTTMAVNLALALTERGARRVCLVDLDLAFGDVAITMQLFPTPLHRARDRLRGRARRRSCSTSLLTRHAGLADGAGGPGPPGRPRADHRRRWSRRLLRTLRETFDYVVIDTAPAFDEQTLTALDETDECVIVATLDVPTLKNVKVALETLDLLDIARDHRHLLLNRADDAVGIGADKVEAILGMPVATQVATSIDDRRRDQRRHRRSWSAKPEHPASVAVPRLASLLAGEPVASPRCRSPHASGESDHAQPRASRRFRIRRAHEQPRRPPRRRPPARSREPRRQDAAAGPSDTVEPARHPARRGSPPRRPSRSPPRTASAGNGTATAVARRGQSAAPCRTTDPPRVAAPVASSTTASRSSRPTCTSSCSSSSARTSTPPTWTRPSSTSGSAPRWPTSSPRRTAR